MFELVKHKALAVSLALVGGAIALAPALAGAGAHMDGGMGTDANGNGGHVKAKVDLGGDGAHGDGDVSIRGSGDGLGLDLQGMLVVAIRAAFGDVGDQTGVDTGMVVDLTGDLHVDLDDITGDAGGITGDVGGIEVPQLPELGEGAPRLDFDPSLDLNPDDPSLRLDAPTGVWVDENTGAELDILNVEADDSRVHVNVHGQAVDEATRLGVFTGHTVFTDDLRVKSFADDNLDLDGDRLQTLDLNADTEGILE